jgi:hypothetical protein
MMRAPDIEPVVQGREGVLVVAMRMMMTFGAGICTYNMSDVARGR